jgi:hypothetical protein
MLDFNAAVKMKNFIPFASIAKGYGYNKPRKAD